MKVPTPSKRIAGLKRQQAASHSAGRRRQLHHVPRVQHRFEFGVFAVHKDQLDVLLVNLHFLEENPDSGPFGQFLGDTLADMPG